MDGHAQGAADAFAGAVAFASAAYGVGGGGVDEPDAADATHEIDVFDAAHVVAFADAAQAPDVIDAGATDAAHATDVDGVDVDVADVAHAQHAGAGRAADAAGGILASDVADVMGGAGEVDAAGADAESEETADVDGADVESEETADVDVEGDAESGDEETVDDAVGEDAVSEATVDADVAGADVGNGETVDVDVSDPSVLAHFLELLNQCLRQFHNHHPELLASSCYFHCNQTCNTNIRLDLC